MKFLIFQVFILFFLYGIIYTVMIEEGPMKNFVVFMIQGLVWLHLRIIFSLFGNLKVENLDLIRRIPNKSFIIISNHISYMDAFLVCHLFPFSPKFFPFRYPSKAQIYYSWLLPFMWLLGAYPIQKGGELGLILKKTLKILDRGGRIMIFPEGKINRTLKPGVAHRGIAYLASKIRVPILPVYIEGFEPDKYNIGFSFIKFLLRKYNLKVSFGESFFLDEVYGKIPSNNEEYAAAANKAMDLVYALKK